MKIKNYIFMVILTALVGLGGGVACAADDVNQIQRSALSPLEADLSELDTAVTALKDGGAQIGNISSGGVISTLGLKSGDIVKNVNGLVLNADQSFQDAVVQVSQSGQGIFSFEVVRNGELLSSYCDIQ